MRWYGSRQQTGAKTETPGLTYDVQASSASLRTSRALRGPTVLANRRLSVQGWQVVTSTLWRMSVVGCTMVLRPIGLGERHDECS